MMTPPTPPALVQPPQPAPNALDLGRKALHEGRLMEARRILLVWLSLHPQDSDALVVAGFTTLRLHRVREALALFQKARRIAPSDGDAAYGLALCLLRQGRAPEAKSLLQEALTRDPSRTDVREALANARSLAPDPPAPMDPLVRPARLQMPARILGQRFEVSDGKGSWRPFFIKGINLGAALPGKHPSQFPDKAIYAGWIAEMAALGVNVVRVYTIHPPGFYEALADHNAKAVQPIWLIHGVWTELPPHDNFRNGSWLSAWRTEMRSVVDLIHGRGDLPSRPGHASGAYRADVSKWTLAIILGREWEPYSIQAYNKRHPGLKDHEGRFLSIRQGHAAEVFMAEAMDYFLAYEFNTYHAQRPLAYTNWPTLDPLTHPTESPKTVELAWMKRLGLPPSPELIREYDNDALGLDMEKMEANSSCQAGLFASYHAYPYYPDFINLDPGYQKVAQQTGRGNYFAYLQDLVRHHRKHPVVISEFGVPSSRLVAHWQAQGMTHGGQSEREQGEQDAQMFRDIHDTGCAGGILFAWIDEWFKKNWLVIQFEEPLERKPLWYNVQDAEENYGLIAYHPGASGPTICIDGRSDDWKTIPDYLASLDLKLKVVADEGWLHLGLFFKGPLPDWSKGGFVVGIDTVDPRLGDHSLPWGLGLRSEAGLEFMVRFQGEQTALFVDAPYDLFTHRLNRPYRSQDNKAGRFVMPMTESNRPRIGRDGTRFPAHRQEIGWLRHGTQDRLDPAFDSRAEWMEGRASDGWSFLEARLPWGLLNVTDPSSHQVVMDSLHPGDKVGTIQTDGFRLFLMRTLGNVQSLSPVQVIPAPTGNTIPRPPLFSWPGWEQPTFHQIRKQSFEILKNCLKTLPD